MAFNPQPNDKQVSLATWGSYVSQTDPTKLPEGVSPAAAEMQFVPGSTQSRPCFQKIFANPTYPNTTCVYGKSYIDPTGVIRNLYLYSNGGVTVENVSTSPGTETALLDNNGNAVFMPAGSYMKSITAFGREYLASNDLLHGADIPMQYDGTYLDRVTQDGPGAPPTISNLIIPAVNLTTGTGTITLAVDEVDPENADPVSGFFTSINVYTTSSLTGVETGQFVTISGTANYNGTAGPITAIFPGSPRSLIEMANYIPAGTNCEAISPNGSCTLLSTPGSMVVSTGPLQRNNNIVSGVTAAPHQLQPGYQVQITDAEATEVGTGISSIVIDNENETGIATITVGLATGQTNHGLVPGCNISITGVVPATVGTSISSIVRAAQIVTVVMAAGTGLNPSSVVTISGVTPASFNGIYPILNVSTTTNPFDTFTYAQVDVDVSGSGGSTAINWPVPDTPAPSYYEVQAAPSATTFQVAVDYADGVWSTGSATFAWNGTFYVLTVPTTTSFTYQQYGPNATAVAVGGGNIVLTPYGQASPGEHQMQVSFLTRQDYITAPSPPVKFTANGGQYLSVTNMPIGPANIKARILEFTGANGAYFFYIPAVPQENGQIVGTPTQVNDNTTTAIVLDFADNTLFNAIGINTQGNNLPNQIVIDGALGFGYYDTRLLTYGQRNIIQGGESDGSLLNMGFDGGYLPNASTLPTGWNAANNAGGALSLAGGLHAGSAWSIAVTPSSPCGEISQGLFADYNGDSLATTNTQYFIRVWLRPTVAAADLTFTVSMTSASTSFSSTAAINGAAMSTTGSWLQATFSAKTPTPVPSDFTLNLYAASTATSLTLLVDELNIVFTETPYTDTILYASYGDNPEAFDGVSGPFGPSEDTHKVMDFGDIRQTLYLLTQDPSGRLHEVINNGSTEPADWDVEEVAANCGAVSAYCLTKSQADDSSASGGEEWMSWISSWAARIFGGGEPWKISQELEPDFAGAASAGATNWSSAFGINRSAALTTWALNDPVARVIYYGLPIGAATAPSAIYHMNYRELDSAEAIAGAPPVHVSFSGKLTAHDNARKWCPWNRPMNGAALMYRAPGTQSAVFFNGNGLTPNTGGTLNFGNGYVLNAAYLTDDDYGQIYPYYIVCFEPTPELAQAEQLGGRKMVSYFMAQVAGVGTVLVTAYVDNLANPWNLTCSRTLAVNPRFDLEWSGGNCVGDRIAFKFASSPATGTNNQLILKNLRMWLRTNARLPIRGAAQ